MAKYKNGDIIEFTKTIKASNAIYRYTIGEGARWVIQYIGLTGYSIQNQQNLLDTLFLDHQTIEESTFLYEGEKGKGSKSSDQNIQEDENNILKMTANIWSTFVSMKQTHPADEDDMAKAIHDIQKIISIRMARRSNPKTFVTIEK